MQVLTETSAAQMKLIKCRVKNPTIPVRTKIITYPKLQKTPQTYKPGLGEGFGQQTRKVLLTVLQNP